LDHYTHTAHTADCLLNPHRDPMPLRLGPPAAGTTPEDLADYDVAMAWLAAEQRVVMAALRYAADTGYDTHAWQLAWALDTFLNRLGNRYELAAAWQIALRSADHLGNPTGQAAAHRLLAYSHTWLGRHDDARNHYHRALDLYTRTGDQVGLAHTHQQVAFLSWQQGDPDAALDHDRQALALFRAAGHRRGEAFTLNAVGWCHALLGQHAEAISYCQQALPLNQDLGDHDGEASTWDSLGYAHHHLGHHDRAVECYVKALALFRELGDRYYESLVLSHLGDTHQEAGDRDAARSAWRSALDILTQLDHVDAASVLAKLDRLDLRPELSITAMARA
jgi:tetratricopeptide (TPR) repeat protein